MEQTTCGPQSSSPILAPRPCTERAIPGPVLPSVQLRPDLPAPLKPCSARARSLDFLGPLDFPCPRPLLGTVGIVPTTLPRVWTKADGHVGTMWARFTAWPARILVLRWVSCQICPIIWTVEFNSHCVLTLSPANIAGRHPLHASRPLPSHMAHSYSKLKI